jgi:hypothetical protein
VREGRGARPWGASHRPSLHRPPRRCCLAPATPQARLPARPPAGWDPALLAKCRATTADISSLDGLLVSAELKEHLQ